MDKVKRLKKRELLVEHENAIGRATNVRREAIREAGEVFDKARDAARTEYRKALQELE